ncbi:MAG: hypothetical protein HQK68_02900 [Desulfamplus sp.]|nr:hypothetical protein [Desulfamplus sp.]
MTYLNTTPIFNYHISGVSEPITKQSSLWNTPFLGKGADGIFLHEYFELAEKFIKSNNCLINYIKDIEIQDIEQISISLEKHGAFYHPAKVEVLLSISKELQCELPIESIGSIKDEQPKLSTKLSKSPILFVLNTAVSAYGLALIYNEYDTLKYLSQFDKKGYLPKVFSVETMRCRGFEIAFLVGTWFDGYKEFHLTDNSKDLIGSASTLNFWNSDGSITPYPASKYFEIYDKASEILTYFYNIKTFEHIAPWHHAAGDFIAKQLINVVDGEIDGFDVKLITIRGYKPIVEISSDDEEDIYKALLLFFLNLTLRMRIDRIDGTGRWCLVDEAVMPFILKGFFNGLKNRQIDSFVDSFKSYLSQFSHENLYQILLIMIETIDFYNTNNIHENFYENTPEIQFIKNNLKSHSEALFYSIGNILL